MILLASNFFFLKNPHNIFFCSGGPRQVTCKQLYVSILTLAHARTLRPRPPSPFSLSYAPFFLKSPFNDKMRRWIALAAHLFIVATSVLASSSSGDSVLVVLDDELKRENFSKFFGELEGTYSKQYERVKQLC